MRSFLFVAALLSFADELWADKICCPGLPCYSSDPPYDYLPLPECPDVIKVNMMLYTRDDSTTGQTITMDTIPSSFKADKLTLFLVHGWEQVVMNPWMVDIKDAAFLQGDYNVIFVTWRGGTEHMDYVQCVSNTRPVGGVIAAVANNTIHTEKSSKALMYCVGHSLGAHVCGQAGQQGQLGRITGLDPAGPGFQDHDWSVGLNPNCADLVDNIHTNGEIISKIGAGMMQPIGDIDFYPNGGRSQPGCPTNQYESQPPIVKDIVTCENQFNQCTADVSPACSHSRVTALFTESIRTPCFLTRFRCSDQEDLPNSCTENKDVVQSMGFNANKYPGRGIFYLKTKACAPFCCKQD